VFERLMSSIEKFRDALPADFCISCFAKRLLAKMGAVGPPDAAGPVSKAEALQKLREEASKAAIEIRDDGDPEVKAYLDWAAKNQGIPPENMHASTIGDVIMIRAEHAQNVRVLREEMIHVEQQRSGVAISGPEAIDQLEIEARERMIERAGEWGITEQEAQELRDEIKKIRESGY
jgi:hypothetical protein